MAHYHFDMPEGWVGAQLPAPHVGAYVRPELPRGPAAAAQAGRTRALILLLSPRPALPSLSESLATLVSQGTGAAHVVRRAEPIAFRSVAYWGLLTAVRLRVAGPTLLAEDPAETERLIGLFLASPAGPRSGESPPPGVPAGDAGSDEGRIFAVLDAGAEHVPVLFAGGPDSLPLHKDALDRVLTSMRPYIGGQESPFAGWTV